MIIGLLYILVPQYLLPVCQNTLTLVNGNTIPMKCFWTANAINGLGAAVCLAGLVICLCTSAAMRMGISLMTGILSLLAIAISVFLIGVCVNEAMPCRIGTLPAICVLSAILFIVSIVNMLCLRGHLNNREAK